MQLTAVLVALSAALGTCSATVTTYSSRASFNADFPGLPLETFEAANVADGSNANFPGPLDKFTSNAVFSPGQILDGLRISTGTSPSDTANLFVSGPGFATYTSHAISYDYADTALPQLTVNFYNGNVTAFGLDITSNPDGQNVTLQLLSGVNILGSYLVSNAQGVGTFIGFSSSDPVTSVQLTDGANYFGVDNVAFGVAVPEPASLSLLALGVCAMALSRRHQR